MLVVGVLLLILGWVFGIGLLTLLGAIVAIVGAVLLVAGAVDRPVGGRRYWW